MPEWFSKIELSLGLEPGPRTVMFRVDASEKIGSGHVVRCLTWAEALRKRGDYCLFVSRDHLGNMNDFIAQKRFHVARLPMDPQESGLNMERGEPYEAWLGTDWQTDSRATLEVLGDRKFDWMIVDHYALDARWETSMKDRVNHIAVIDDMVDRPHTCDVLLNQNDGFSEDEYQYLAPPHCQFVLGSEHALLRPEFAQWRKYSLERRKKSSRVKNILISMGGSDTEELTYQVLDALKSCVLPHDVQIAVVMGWTSSPSKRVESLACDLPYTIDILGSVENMAEIMANSDLAIGTSGSSAWERSYLGLPSIVYVVEKNQERIASAVCGGDCKIIKDFYKMKNLLRKYKFFVGEK